MWYLSYWRFVSTKRTMLRDASICHVVANFCRQDHAMVKKMIVRFFVSAYDGLEPGPLAARSTHLHHVVYCFHERIVNAIYHVVRHPVWD